MTKTRTFQSFAAGCVLLAACSACVSYKQAQPTRPTQVRGWIQQSGKGVDSLAELLLNEGESSENGAIGVKVLRISPEIKRVGVFDHPPQPEAVLRFYRVSDQEPVKDVTVWTGGRVVNESVLSDPDFGIQAIYVNGISTRDRWIWLDLRR